MGDCLSSLAGSGNQQPAPAPAQTAQQFPPQQSQTTISWAKCYNGECPPMGFVDGGTGYLVARSLIDGNLKVGTYHMQGRCCYIPHGGKAHTVSTDYEILLAPPNSYHWVPTKDGMDVGNSIPGGKMKDGRLLCIGRVDKNGQKIIGSIGQTSCYYPDGSNEGVTNGYDILVSWTPELAAQAKSLLTTAGTGGVKASDFNPGKWSWAKYHFVFGGKSSPAHPIEVQAGHLVARMKIGNDWVLGDYGTTLRRYVTWHDGREVTESNADRFECMDSDQVDWVDSSNGQVVARAVPCGDRNGETVYVGRVHSGGNYRVAKVLYKRKSAYYYDYPREESSDTYQILVYRD